MQREGFRSARRLKPQIVIAVVFVSVRGTES
jgi:hypothetical protein